MKCSEIKCTVGRMWCEGSPRGCLAKLKIWRWWEKSKDERPPNPSNRTHVAIRSPHGFNLLLLRSNEAYKTVFLKEVTSWSKAGSKAGVHVEGCTIVLKITSRMGSWKTESGIEAKGKRWCTKKDPNVFMILFGRDAGFAFIATEEIRVILEKMLYGRMILEFGIFRLEGTSKTFGFSNPDLPSGEGSRPCRVNTGYLLGICLLGLWLLEAKKSQAVVLCWRCAEQESACRGLELHNPCLTPCNICWLLFICDDCRSDVHLALRPKSGGKDDEKLNHSLAGLYLHLN